MNIKKGIIAGVMVAAIGMTTLTSVYANDNSQAKSEPDIAICTVGCEFQWNFDELSKEFKDNISKADYKKAEELFSKATKLGEDASKYWDELYKLDLFGVELVEELSFKDLSKEFKKDIKPEVMKKAEELFNKALKLEKENKEEEAFKVWDELFAMNLFDDSGVIEIIDEEFDDVDVEYGDIMIENYKPFTFEDFSQDFKKDVKPEVLQKAKELFNKAIKAEEESIKVWDELYNMDIFESIDDINGDYVEDFSKMDW